MFSGVIIRARFRRAFRGGSERRRIAIAARPAPVEMAKIVSLSMGVV
jgi:hypothetical protein